MIVLCKQCHALDAVVEGLCPPCLTERMATATAFAKAIEANVAAKRQWRGRPPARYNEGVGSSHGGSGSALERRLPRPPAVRIRKRREQVTHDRPG
jgi:hypothetical protein